MNKKAFIALGVLVVAGVAAWFLLPQSEEAAIRKEISQANYCNQASDCQLVDGQCPFGCFLAVNKSEAARIKGLVDAYQSTCIYSCIEVRGTDCVNNKCVVLEGSGPRACTMEAKLCPDGSYVGRTGPNCEFAPCPGE